MRRSMFALSASALALVLAASPALAEGGGQRSSSSSASSQTASATSELRIGDDIEGKLDSRDRLKTSDGDNYRYKDFRVSARAGQRLEATLRSDAFDAYLEVYAPGVIDTALAEDDDGLGEGTDSRLRFTAPSDGVYTLRARTFSGGDGGDYRLALSERPAAAPAPRPSAIRVGATARGRLADNSPVDDDDNAFAAYSFRASANQRFAISMKSEDFDSLVRVGQMTRGSFVELAKNDDGGDGLNSYLVFTAPEAGDYVIRATSFSSDSSGAFTVSLENGPPPLRAEPIRIGDAITGAIRADTGVNDEGVKAGAYRFNARAGQRVDIQASSTSLDTYLELFDASGNSLGSDDDGAGDGTNSRLFHTFDADGVYTVQVRNYSGSKTGSYSLRLDEAAPLPDPTPLAYNRTIQGELKVDGGRDDQGRIFDAYTFQGTAGNRAQIVMQSGDFDTYLEISRPDGKFEALASDDDGLGEGTDSRLIYALPESGTYVVRALAYGGGAKGLYSIRLTDRGPQPRPGSIMMGATARGTLSENDAVAEDGSFYDAYRVRLTEGDKVRITMSSNDFDAFLNLGREEDGDFESIMTDDDGLSDTNAKIDWTVDRTGTYVIRANSYASGKTGAYVLTVGRQR